MLGIRFIKFPPTTFVLHYRNGKVVREGKGLSFLYYAPTSTVVAVPQASQDLPFVFKEVTSDFQEVTIQGQLTYRVANPDLLAQMLDFSVDGRGLFRSEDPDLLANRLVNAVQVQARVPLKLLELRRALVSVDEVTRDVLRGLREMELVHAYGLEVLGLNIVSIAPNPDMARALEAEAREELNQRSDEAIYRRRKAAVEQERKIKETELATELAVEAKQREIREARVAADISVEESREALIEQRVANEKKEAEARAYGLETILAPVQDVPWQKLVAMGSGGADPGLLIAGAFHEMAGNAAKIGELNMSPDLLKSLLRKS